MTDTSSNIPEPNERHGIFAWMLFPIALFPLVALLTYDWRAVLALNDPPATSSNWIGPLGDWFAYYGYQLFGLAVWVLPILCVIAALCTIRGRRMRPGRRILWFCVFLITLSSILQVIGNHTGWVGDMTERLNIANPGGAIGYLAMSRFLTPLLSDFGASVIMVILMAIALAAAIGVHNLAAFFNAIFTWATARDRALPDAADTTSSNPLDSEREAYLAALQAKAEAKRQREEEKRRIREERRAAKEAARTAKDAARNQPAPAVAPPPQTVADGTQPQPQPDKGPYVLPPVSLLNPVPKASADHGNVKEMSKRLIDTLKLFNIDATLAYTVQGPVVTKYALSLAPGTRYSAVTSISDNLMGALYAKSLRIEAPIPGEDCVGIEVPNRTPIGITFREIIESDAWRNSKGELPLLFGKDAAGNVLVSDLASMPHMLVAGATGQGKSVCLNSIINGLLMTRTPDQLKLIMVDPKSVEFSAYASLPHLMVPVITENKKVVFSLHWAVAEMEKRLKLFARAKVKNIYDFNHRPQFTQTDMFGNDTEVGTDMPRTIPYIVIIIDEVADLMSTSAKEVVPDIARLTAKARAAGIHLILATQRPDAKVITGTIKANIPGRVAFKTAQAIDSRTILDESGAENLIGKGDMLFKGKDGILIRAQGAWISDQEIDNIIRFIEQHSNVQFDERFAKKLGTIKEEEVDLFADPEETAAQASAEAQAAREQVKAENNASDFKKAIECIINTKRASTSHFQRQMGWGYNHAAKIVDMLEREGIVGPQSGAGPRPIIMDQDQLIAILNGDDASVTGDAPDDDGDEDGSVPQDDDDIFSSSTSEDNQ